MEFAFDNHSYNKLLDKIGVQGVGLKVQLKKVFIPWLVCWVPLAIGTLINGTFWTGNVSTSFITDFDVQARLLVAMPLFLLADKVVSARLGLLLGQFVSSGIVDQKIQETFEVIVRRNLRFLKSKWVDFTILVICYIQLFLVFSYESESTSQLSWQVNTLLGETSFNFPGVWFALIGGPFVLFLSYRWLLRIAVWGRILYKISKLEITLFPMHPDSAGGLGFLGYGLRYFSPIAFAISAVVAGNMADFMLTEGVRLNELKLPAVGYFILITLIFSMPLLSFVWQLINAREKCVYENNDYMNGILRELRIKMQKGYKNVTAEDLNSPDFSAAADLSMVVENALKMKYVPFTLKDFVPLWVMTAIPFLGVVIIEIPVNQLFNNVVSLMI